MNVQDIMTTDMLTIEEHTPYLEVVQLFLQHHVHGAPIVDSFGTLVGVISEKDLMRALYPAYRDFYSHPERYMVYDGLHESMEDARKKQVRHIMNKRLVTARPQMDIARVGGLMVASGIHRMPVVDQDNKLVGMISRHRIYEHLIHDTFHIGNAKKHATLAAA